MRKHCLTFAACSIASLANAQNATAEFDERGAVLCSYAIVTALNEYSQNCDKSNSAMAVELARLLVLHRDFVAHNGQRTVKEFAAFERENIKPYQPICQSGGIGDFFAAVETDLNTFSNELEESLSVDRKPVWNPCL